MGLFDKKYCDICSEKIGLLGNRKLSDGNLCKNCAAKLSPWFSERRQSSVAEIAEQLKYREANRELVADFKPTRSFGELKKFLVDEKKMLFAVTSARNLVDDNPDLIPCSDITGFRIDVNESRSEVTYKDSEGKSVSYNPPLYKYSYDWYAIISVNNPYFNEIRFKLNSSSATIEPIIPAVTPVGNAKAASKLGTHPGVTPQGRPVPANGIRPIPGGKPNPLTDASYQRCDAMAAELKAYVDSLFGGGSCEPAAVKEAVNCPFCGATTVPDASGCCEYCGSALN